MRKLGILLIVFVVMFSACVPREKIIYLQKSESDKNQKAGDVLDGYNIKDFEYRLKSEDIISIKVASLTETEFDFFRQSESQMMSGDPILSGYVLDKQGFVELPYVDKINLKGLTLSEAEIKIKETLTGYLNSPTVFVKLLSFQFTVLGEVRGPSRYTSYTSKINIMEAIGTAGDLTDFADRSKIKIVRFENDNAQIFFVNALEDDLLTSPYFYLQPGDVVIVPPLKVKTLRLYGLANAGLIFSTVGALTIIFREFIR